ncbi:Protein Brevis radix-like 1 [Acorus gramineus]|uniref:Protein Brevis radix-like 1 n=1 Tax=Acorus gramineus TaxID=55184 RepID=A0AAV9AEQ6_ACOGR|nr:Protein Brevis radix-like 1 [Acorus gramineus]
MLTCIACSKQLDDAGEDNSRGTSSTKESVKSLTSQIKDMALKFSGAYKQHSKPFTPRTTYQRRTRRNGDIESATSDGGGYPYLGKTEGGSSSSTPAWDFTSMHREPSDSRFKPVGGWSSSVGYDGWVPGGGGSYSGEEVVVLDEEERPKEWMAQVEPGVHITFVSLPTGGNDLKRIRFSREMFNKWQAQRWWGENYDRIMELYNVQRFNRQALATPPRSEDERDSSYSRMGSTRESPIVQPLSCSAYRPATGVQQHQQYQQHHVNIGGGTSGSGICRGETSSVDASRTTTSSRDEASVSISNASDLETEWVEQDQPGVYITIRALPDGTRELRRVRFSRERFGEVHAKLWWEENRERIQAQYL